jgi:hypothetical protein
MPRIKWLNKFEKIGIEDLHGYLLLNGRLVDYNRLISQVNANLWLRPKDA